MPRTQATTMVICGYTIEGLARPKINLKNKIYIYYIII